VQRHTYLIVAHGHRFVDIVSNCADLSIALHFLLDGGFLKILLLLLQVDLLCEQFSGILLVLVIGK
jgi:hypothetical protein